MNTVTAAEAGTNIVRLINDVASEHEPVKITSDETNAVLISEDDWNAVQETLYLLSVPKMRESIVEGMETPVEECETEVAW